MEDGDAERGVAGERRREVNSSKLDLKWIGNKERAGLEF